ncbi:hypothetical protein [Streptantibioticus ferralitis]|uniref:Uncharacterized protein n=1 Tax=Streptantibioticus ferralitis TaxID=236510 RepID=A0ABT5YRS9_9ACTN|nr:hypothetical protein [Streptantibioticus ferralitis]MDF2254290.1 hypothetical protein [Streptantibioticus ferralitis]
MGAQLAWLAPRVRLPGRRGEQLTQNLRGGNRLADFWRLTVDISREQLIAGGYVTPYELDEFHALLRDDDFRDLALALGQSWGHRSGPRARSPPDSPPPRRAPRVGLLSTGSLGCCRM